MDKTNHGSLKSLLLTKERRDVLGVIRKQNTRSLHQAPSLMGPLRLRDQNTADDDDDGDVGKNKELFNMQPQWSPFGPQQYV